MLASRPPTQPCSSTVQEQAAAPHQAVLEQARELALAERHVRAALGQRRQHIRERAEAFVDRGTFRERHALRAGLALPLAACSTLLLLCSCRS